MNGLADRTAAELLAAYRGSEATPLDAVRACLSRISEVEPAINAVLTLCEEQALRRARESAERWRAGTPRPLEGIPVGVKDIIYTANVRTTGGSKLYADHIPQYSATVVERLEEAGAIILAKVQTMEFAMGGNAHYGPTRNPWDPERTPGGSSVGSGAALAAREVPLALGTDTGGSIRVPAAYCGIVGLKPTLGRVSRYGVMPLSWTLDHVGPMARSVEDVALMLSVLAGHDARDPRSLRAESENYSEALRHGVKGLRLGIPGGWLFELLDREVEAATFAAVEVLAGEGIEVVEVALPHAHLSEVIGWMIMYAEFASLHEDTLARFDEYGGPMTRRLLANAQFVTAQDYLRALRTIPLLQQEMEQVFDRVDALITPGMVITAPRLEQEEVRINGEWRSWEDAVARTMFLADVTGVPALALPAGFSRTGLPVGVQILAKPLDEATCLRVGYAYQQVTSFHKAIPPLLKEATAG